MLTEWCFVNLQFCTKALELFSLLWFADFYQCSSIKFVNSLAVSSSYSTCPVKNGSQKQPKIKKKRLFEESLFLARLSCHF